MSNQVMTDQLQDLINKGLITIDADGTARMKEEAPKPQRANAKPNKGIDPFAKRFPLHLVKVSLLIRHNRELARLTSLALLKYLEDKGDIYGYGKFINFKYDKFSVRYNGLIREYSYKEDFFITCMMAALDVFYANAVKTLTNLTRKEFSKSAEQLADENVREEITEYLTKHSDECDVKDDLEGVSYRES